MSTGVSAAEPPAVFARRHFGNLDLGDERLERRAIKLGEAVSAAPEQSLPRQCGDFHQAKAAYRFFNHPNVTAKSVSATHCGLTLEEARQQPLVLFIQDTTPVSFAGSKPRDGAGVVGYGEGGPTGLLLHSTLALVPGRGGAALGLAHLEVWARPPVRRGETREQRRKRADRESLRWQEAIRAVGAPPQDARWVHVADREADVWETFCAVGDVGGDCVIRARGAAASRKAVLGHGEQVPSRSDCQDLEHLARSLPEAGACSVERHARPGIPRRILQLKVSFDAVTVLPPRLVPESAPQQLWIVRAWEEKGPAGEDPAEWLLLTTMPVRDVTDALKVVDWYRHRWAIEELHKCIKTGCRLEGRQLQSVDRLEPLTAMIAIVALRLLNLKHIAKFTPDAPATDAVPMEHVQMLSKLRNIPVEELTCYRFWRETAKLGGFLGRNSDGEPGWQTLWLGWRDLDMLVRGATVAGWTYG